MKFSLLFPDEIERDWERIGRLLAPAIARDEQRQAIDVYRDLMNGDMAMIDVDLGDVKGVGVIELAPSETALNCCWVIYIAGRIDGAGRHWTGRVHTLMSYIEGIARAHDCTEMRLEGRRAWGSVFPDWERLDARPGRHELRKVL